MASCSTRCRRPDRGAVLGPLASFPPSAPESKCLSLNPQPQPADRPTARLISRRSPWAAWAPPPLPPADVPVPVRLHHRTPVGRGQTPVRPATGKPPQAFPRCEPTLGSGTRVRSAPGVPVWVLAPFLDTCHSSSNARK